MRLTHPITAFVLASSLLPSLALAQDDASIPWNPTHDGREGVWDGILLPGLIAPVTAYIMWQLFVRLLISQKNRIHWEKLRYRWPTAMAISLCISVWILNGDYSRSSNLIKIATVTPSLLCLFLNFPILIAIAPVAWLTEGANEAPRLAYFFATGWLSWYGLLCYCENIASSGELTFLDLNPPPPAHKS